jgi:hypothetical protein
LNGRIQGEMHSYHAEVGIYISCKAAPKFNALKDPALFEFFAANLAVTPKFDLDFVQVATCCIYTDRHLVPYQHMYDISILNSKDKRLISASEKCSSSRSDVLNLKETDTV